MQLLGCSVVTSDVCQVGMVSQDFHGTVPAKKPIKFMTHSNHIARWVRAKCTSDNWHVQLVDGRAKACQVYPRNISEAMLRGPEDQLVADGLRNSDGSLFMTGHDEDRYHDWETYYDDLSHLPLRSDLVDKARQEEMEVFAKFPVYTKVPLLHAYHFTGKGPIETKWVDVNKSDESEPAYRSRLVAKEIKRKHDEDIVSPPQAQRALEIL